MTQIIVDKDAKDFQLTILHMNSKGKLISSSVTSLYNSRDVFVHQEGTQHPKLRFSDLRLRPDKHDKKAKRGARSKPYAPRHGKFPDC